MNKALAGIALVITGLLTVAGLATAAQAYPEITFEAEVSEVVVIEGERFEASSSASVECDWTHEFNGKRKRGEGTSFTSTHKAPQVKEETVIPVNFTCEYDGSATAGRAVMVPAETATRSIDVTVLPRESDRDGSQTAAGQSALPNTGGPSQYILLGGLLLLVLGGLAAWAARRRGEGRA